MMTDPDDITTRPLVPAEHIPLTPPRKGHSGELAYLELWQRYVSRCDDETLQALFGPTRIYPLTQRQASVAASFITWLGTNCGRALTREAEEQKKSPNWRDNWDSRYLRQWELSNRRIMGINGGLRYCEAILAEDRATGAQCTLRTAPVVTVDDLDVIECVCIWLATQDGRFFLQAAEAAVEAHTRARYLFGEQHAEEAGDGGVLEGTNRTTSGAIGQP